MKKQSYFSLAKEYGIIQIVFSFDLIPAIILTAFISKIFFRMSDFSNQVSSIILTLIGANAGLLGIVLAGWAILISLMQGKFIKFMKDQGLFTEIVFLFTHSSILISIGLLSSILLSLFLKIDIIMVSKILFVLAIGFTIYGILSILFLLLSMKKYAFLRGEFLEVEDVYDN